MWGGAGADLFIIYGSDVVKSDTDRINDLNFSDGDQILLARFGLGTFGAQSGGAKSSLPTGINVNGLGADYAMIGSIGDLVRLVGNTSHVGASKSGTNDLSLTISDTNGPGETLQLAGLYSAYVAAGGQVGGASVAGVPSSLDQSGPAGTTAGAPIASLGSQLAPVSGTSIVTQPPSSTSTPIAGTTSRDVTFTSSGGVRSLVVVLAYDPGRVTIAAVVPGADLPVTARIGYTTAESWENAELRISVTSDEPLPGGPISLLSLKVAEADGSGVVCVAVERVNGNGAPGSDLALRVPAAHLDLSSEHRPAHQ